jgi:hypothetical protein
VRVISTFLRCKRTGHIYLRRLRRRWEDNIRMDLKEIGINKRNWIDSAQNMNYWRALVKCGIEPPGYITHGVS